MGELRCVGVAVWGSRGVDELRCGVVVAWGSRDVGESHNEALWHLDLLQR